jgi:hypothetical protein
MAVWDNRSLGPKHLAADLKWEPQRVTNYQLNIFDLPGQGTEMIMLALVNFSLPTVSNEVINIKHGNTDVKFAGTAQWQGSDQLTVIDYITTDISKMIDDWRALVYNSQNDAIGWAARYKKNGSVTESGPDGTNLREWKYEGIWPSQVEYGELNHESTTDVRRINIQIQYDRAFRV